MLLTGKFDKQTCYQSYNANTVCGSNVYPLKTLHLHHHNHHHLVCLENCHQCHFAYLCMCQGVYTYLYKANHSWHTGMLQGHMVYFLHLHASSSRTAFGAGSMSIQSGVSALFSRCHPFPSGDGMLGYAQRLFSKYQLGNMLFEHAYAMQLYREAVDETLFLLFLVQNNLYLSSLMSPLSSFDEYNLQINISRLFIRSGLTCPFCSQFYEYFLILCA